jgi:hypothetical protein
MEWLEAMLAFAVVMMIFATFVSAIIEVLHRITRIREDGLQSMMIQVYEQIVEPGLKCTDQTPSSTREDFVDQMTQTRLLPLPTGAKFLRKLVYKTVNAQRLMSLPTEKFLQQFIETKDGQQLIKKASEQGRTKAVETLKSIAARYGDFGDSAKDFFTRRSRLLSTLIAVLLAISVNLDALTLFKTFLADKGVRQVMIDKGDAVAAELQRMEDRISTRATAGNESDTDIKKELLAKAEGIQSSLDDLKASGVPIGWETAPWHSKAFLKVDNYFSKLTILVGWFLSVLLGGLLVGLGGPFWYDTFRKLSSLASVSVRGQQDKKPQPGKNPQETDFIDNLLDQTTES